MMSFTEPRVGEEECEARVVQLPLVSVYLNLILSF